MSGNSYCNENERVQFYSQGSLNKIKRNEDLIRKHFTVSLQISLTPATKCKRPFLRVLKETFSILMM